MKTCELCGRPFEPSSHYPQKRFCGRGCSQKANRRKASDCADIDLPLFDRFMARVEKTATCWNWTGSANSLGYGATAWIDSPEPIASRLSWHLHRGPIPAGLMVLHHCDQPRCVNPDHLFLGDHSANAKDYVDKGLMRHLHRRDAMGRWTSASVNPF